MARQRKKPTTTTTDPQPGSPSRRRRRVPGLCRHKGSGQGYVRLNGKSMYLGKYEDPKTVRRYEALMSEWLKNDRTLPTDDEDDDPSITIVELLAQFIEWSKKEYAATDGVKGTEYDKVRWSLRPLKELHGHLLADRFRIPEWDALVDDMIDRDWSRRYINSALIRVRRLFSWAHQRDLIDDSTWAKVSKAKGLKQGQRGVREGEDREAVPLAHVEAIKPHVSQTVADILDVLLFTGARPSELLGLRGVDLNCKGQVWTAKLRKHKNAKRNKRRVLHFGPKAQSILTRRMQDRALHDPIFGLRESYAERAAARSTKGQRRRPGQKSTPTTTDRKHGEVYSSTSLRRCVAAACVKARIPKWSPYQLRHSSAQLVRGALPGTDHVQRWLGHSSAAMSENYAPVADALAVEAALKVG